MVKNAPGITHSRARQNHARALEVIDLHRVLRRSGDLKSLEVVTQRALGDELRHLFVKNLFMLHVEFRGLDGHWAIEEDRKRLGRPFAKHPAQQADQKLHAAHRECGNKDFATRNDSFLNDTDEFVDGFVERSMVAVTICGLQEDHVSVMERLKITKDWNAFGAEITRKDHGLLMTSVFDLQLDTGGPQHVTGLCPRCLNALRDRHWVAVGNGTHLRDDLLCLLHLVKRLAKRFAFTFEAAVLPQHVLGLYLRGIPQNQRAHIDCGWRGKHWSAVPELGQQWQSAGVVEV